MKLKQQGRDGERGTALVSVMIVVMALATVAVTLLTRVDATAREQRSAKELEAARLVAEAGLNVSFALMREGGDTSLGSLQDKVDFGGGSFWVEEQDLGDGVTRLVSNGFAQGRQVQSELVLEEIILTEPSYGVFGDEMLQIDSNAFIDSYKSSLGTYSSQAVNSDGSDVWANEKGHTGSNANIYISQNAGIHGDATPGVSQSVVISGTNADVSGSTLPAGEPFVMPSLSPPTGALSGAMVVDGTQSLGPGTYFLNSLTLKSNSHLDVTGPVIFVLGSLELKSNAQLLVDSTGGGAEFYVHGDFELQSNTLLATNSRNPAELAVNLKGNNVIDPGVDVEIDEDLEVGFKSNSKMYGTLFAPKAFIEIRSNFELYGSLMARRLLVSSNSMIHYDESLSESDEDEEIDYQIVGWRSVPVTGGAN